jgi:hypothetical protein
MILAANKLHASNVEETGTAKGMVPESVDDSVRNTGELRMSSAQCIGSLRQVNSMGFTQELDGCGRNPFGLTVTGAILEPRLVAIQDIIALAYLEQT